MSTSSFAAFLNAAGSNPAQAATLREALSSSTALVTYASAHGFTIAAGEADRLIAQARAQGIGGPQPLSDESLDHVSGAGPRKAHFS